MPIRSSDENDLLEALSEASTAGEVFLAAFDALDDTVDHLLQSIFHKDDYAVKFVVDPLLTSDGPLGDILIRLKLLLGLGVINKENYDDIEIFVNLKEWTKIQDGKVDFSDIDIIFELNKVSAIQNIMPIVYDDDQISNSGPTMQKMFIERYNQRVQSTIILAITHIIELLSRDNLLV